MTSPHPPATCLFSMAGNLGWSSLDSVELPQKPFTAQSLTTRVREALASPRTRAPG
jgi:hypothetical protein